MEHMKINIQDLTIDTIVYDNNSIKLNHAEGKTHGTGAYFNIYIEIVLKLTENTRVGSHAVIFARGE